MTNETTVDYRISIRPSDNHGYQTKSGNKGVITLYVGSIWKDVASFDDFVNRLIWVSLTERICIERAFQKVRMKNRCEPVCKPGRIADLMLYPDDWEYVRLFYEEQLQGRCIN